MTAKPQDEADEAHERAESPLEGDDAARQVAHLTGMTPEAADTFAGFHNGRFAPFRRAA